MKQIPHGDYCPLIKKTCIEHKCSWYIHVRGMDPNTGENLDHWGCSVTWLPTLTIENSQQQRQTGAAVESFRNEVVKANQENRTLFTQDLINNFGVIPTNVTPITNSKLELKGDEEE
ncbi:MAG: hypothetical protein ACO3UU_05335 [Minisyncoccia bacterium]